MAKQNSDKSTKREQPPPPASQVADEIREWRRTHAPITEESAENLRELIDLLCRYQQSLEFQVERFLAMTGGGRACQWCGRPIWFYRTTKSGRAAPFTAELINHWADCPKAPRPD